MPAQAWVTLIVGVVAAVGVVASWRQKVDADRRAEWWRRISWSFDYFFNEEEKRSAFGLELLWHLSKSNLATRDDNQLFQAVAEDWLMSHTESDRKDGGAA